MPRHARSWCLLALALMGSLATGYFAPRPGPRGGDVLDAVAAVLRQRSLFAVPERGRPYQWTRQGGIYLCRTRKTAEELDCLIKDPKDFSERWQGIVYFKAYQRGQVTLPFAWAEQGPVVYYEGFAVYGDPELLREVHAILADRGFETCLPG